MIPENIHLIYINDNNELPDYFKKNIPRIQRFHPSWTVRLYNTEDAVKIIEEHLPEYLAPYRTFKYDIQRADFFRIALVYLFGGFYMDLDMHCFKSLNELRKHSIVLAEEKIISENTRRKRGLKYKQRIANYMFGSRPKHPFWLEVLDRLSLLALTPITSQQDILDITGPGFLTDIFHERKSFYPDITLLTNRNYRCLHPQHNEISCHFGDFAAHLHIGSWRKSIN